MSDRAKFQPGEQVRIQGQEPIGQLVRIVGTRAIIAFETVEISIPLSQLEPVRPAIKDIAHSSITKPTTQVVNLPINELSSFNPEIDLHGMHVSEALEAVDRWIDKALLLGHRHLRIIHGKGKGILRREIRAHLQACNQVKKVISQHPYSGSEGVTWIERWGCKRLLGQSCK